MRKYDMRREFLPEYAKEDYHSFYINCSSIEAEGYGQWPRLKETIEFCKKMNYKKIGIAFCKGLHKEAPCPTLTPKRETAQNRASPVLFLL
ncbi:MAG TPA: DUF1847 domain-containing protein [Candidatus Blautia faecipullorum]|nr:DUF1847 domain-containing protein [Candidatus Blautia faecipullorum]